jgi:uncharacterized phage-associated protein
MKLNKLFYYLDFISYRDRKQTVTGETYAHLPKGPFAKGLELEIINEAVNSGALERQEEASEKFGKRNRFKTTESANLDVFDEYEKQLLFNICDEFSIWKTGQMVAQTHSEAPWVFSDANQDLDYEEADDIEFFLESATA